MKKMLCVVLAVLLCASGVVFAFSDIDSSDKKLTEAVELMTRFGILNGYGDGTFRPQNEITRAEFSKVIIETIMTEETTDGTETKFLDVSDGHWAKDYIYLSRKLGIVNGMTVDTFAPENKITYEQSIKMIVAALGYDKQASENGGWPNGYIKVAADLGITKGITFNNTDNATRGDVVLMLNNALNLDYYILDAVDEIIETKLSDITLYERHTRALKYNDKDNDTTADVQKEEENKPEQKEDIKEEIPMTPDNSETATDVDFTLTDENGEYDNADLIDESYAEDEEADIPMQNSQELTDETDVDDFEYLPVGEDSIG